ncbi:MAG: winged helix-turn-helix domain-containing protein [Bacteroidota bacterium]
MELTRLPFDQPFRLHNWVVHPLANTITKGKGEITSVEPRVMAVLTYLAHHSGQVVLRETLLDAVWEGVVVNEDALTRAISELRKLLGDDPRRPAVIETIRGRGYRLIAPVVFGDAEPPLAESSHTPDAVRMVAPSARALRLGWLVGGALVVVVLLAGAAIAFRDPVPTVVQAPPEAATPFTTYPGREIDPVVSPEGARVAFAWNEDGDDFNLYVKQTSREKPLQLTQTPGFEGAPAWSPDGSEIAFFQGSGEAGIYSIPSMGGPARLLHPLPYGIESMDWSPDGETIVFAAPIESGGPNRMQRLDLRSGKAQLFVSTDEPMAFDRSPRFSPDGQRIAFVRGILGNTRRAYLADVATGELVSYAGAPAPARDLDWKDDRTLVLASYRSGTFDLWKHDIENGEVAWLPSRGEWTHAPSVAALTGTMVYQDLYFEKDIWRIRLDGPGGNVLGTEPLVVSTWLDCEAQLSPGQDRLVFVSSRSGTMELWVSEADGSEPAQLTDFGGPFVGYPRWSPDGTQIAFSSAPDGPAGVFVMADNGRRALQVSPTDWNTRFSGWTPDGEGVYFSAQGEAGWALWRVSTDGGQPVKVSQHQVLNAAVTPDGSTLYFTRVDVPGLWRSAFVGGQTGEGAEVVLPDIPISGAYDWVLSERGIYALSRRAEGTFVIYYDLESEGIQTISEVIRIANPSLSVSADGSTLLYARVEGSRSDIFRTQVR